MPRKTHSQRSSLIYIILVNTMIFIQDKKFFILNTVYDVAVSSIFVLLYKPNNVEHLTKLGLEQMYK